MEISSFYSELYQSEPIDVVNESYLIDSISSKLPDSARQSLESSFDIEECTNSLKAMKLCKSPGSDGFPAEFYYFFWKEIAADLVDVFNFSFSKGLLSESMRQAILTLIFKRGDKCDLKNWRPISLLNVDYKIATKALTCRLKTVLQHVINNDQTCSVPNR